MIIRAFEMQLYPGQVVEYRRRHDAIWPELKTALLNAGVRDYRIFCNEATGRLFAIMQCADNHAVDALPELEVMQRWWACMADIMETESDDAPVETALAPVFCLSQEPGHASR